MMNFLIAIDLAYEKMMTSSTRVMRGRWQGVDVSRKPDMSVHEINHYTMRVPMSSTDLDYYRRQINPNLPWADDHFLERVGGNPLNPGVEWRNWPWGRSADKFRLDPKPLDDPSEEPVFDHTYAQRYWPKWAGKFPQGILSADCDLLPVRRGIYFDYGDLDDVVTELYKDPTTRQAILPVFFPEDTGYRPGRRKPCSLMYHFILQPNEMSLDIVYYLRSCDLVHHMRDDIYLTVRLLLWMLEQLREADKFWDDVRPGEFVMHISNLHCFVNQYNELKNEPAPTAA